ncbi:hypothetical protein QEN19_003875 [Hanseniaspora menglaensis]
MPSSNVDYTLWNKEELINKIKALETQTNLKNDVLKNDTKSELKPFSYLRRKVTLKFSYLGYNYCGLAYQTTDSPLPTVEETIFKSMVRVRLLDTYDPETLVKLNFSRCGRTDRGVSAMNQVMCLDLRSKFNSQEEIDNRDNDNAEINYIKLLNSALPEDIWIHSVSLNCSSEFDARFSCKYRHYRYYFKLEPHMNLEAMKEGCKNYVGENKDYRNFCKIDGSKQISNYKRTMFHCDILSVNPNENVYCLDLKGTAFLWHQVRCMMAILLVIAEGQENPNIINRLMDTEGEFPTKPDYNMADDTPLVLYDCVYKNENEIKWMTNNDFKDTSYMALIKRSSSKSVYSLYYENLIKLEMNKNLIKFNPNPTIVFNNETRVVSFDKNEFGSNFINHGDGIHKKCKSIIPLEKRTRLRSFKDTNDKWKQKKKEKKKL